MKTVNLSNSTLVAFVDDEDYQKISKRGWSLNSNGYAKCTIRMNGKSRTLLMHRLIMGITNANDLDHINRNRLDNRKLNLRECNRSQNLSNQGLSSKNTTGYKGVCYDKSRNKYEAYIKHHSKKIFLGRFNTAIEAATAYNIKAFELKGEFARLNGL